MILFKIFVFGHLLIFCSHQKLNEIVVICKSFIEESLKQYVASVETCGQPEGN